VANTAAAKAADAISPLRKTDVPATALFFSNIAISLLMKSPRAGATALSAQVGMIARSMPTASPAQLVPMADKNSATAAGSGPGMRVKDGAKLGYMHNY
jgi:hypothetical protein